MSGRNSGVSNQPRPWQWRWTRRCLEGHLFFSSLALCQLSPAGRSEHTWIPSASLSRGLRAFRIIFAGVYRKLPLWRPAVVVRLAKSDSVWKVQDQSGVFLTSLEKEEREEPPGMWVPRYTSQRGFPGENRTYPPLDSSPGQGKGFITIGEF